MKQRYLLLLLCLLLFQGAKAQVPVQIYVESFGTDGNGVRYTTTPAAQNETGIFQRANNPVANFLNPAAVTGVDADGYFWASEGEKTTASPQPKRLTLTPVTVAGYQNLEVNLAMADASQGFEPATPRWENNDYVRVKVRVTQANGTVEPWVTVGQFVGDNPTPLVAGNLRQDTDLDGKSYDEPSAPLLTGALTSFTFPVAGIGRTLEIMIEMDHLGTSEEFAFDNIRLMGDGVPLSNDANLSNLVLSSGTLSPAFASGTTSYTSSVANVTTSITVTPTVAEANATVTVNGVPVSSGSASGPIALTVGSNSITTTVTAQDGTTTLSYTTTVTRASVLQWVGTVSTDWLDGTNWSSGQVPGAGDVILIPAGAVRFPLIASGTPSVLNLTIASGASLSITGGVLEVKGTYLNTGGTLSSTGGTVAFTGTAQQTVGETAGSEFFNLTAGPAGVSLTGPIRVRGVLRLEGNLETNGNSLTILSDATSTGMVVNAGGAVQGTAVVQRYIDPANPLRGYRHYSSPVAGATFTDLSTAGFTPIVNASFNTLPAPPMSSFTAATYPNIFGYNESRLSADFSGFDIGWESPTSLSSSIVPGKAYSVLLPASATVDLEGALHNGNLNVSLSRGPVAESGWHLLGNPYPGPIDWDLLGMSGGVYVFRSTGPGTGSYVSYNNGIGGFDGVLPMMQGFFYRATGAGTFSFTNVARLTEYANPAFRRKRPETRPLVEMQLAAVDGKKDQAFFYFEKGATAAFDEQFDAYKLLENTNGQPTLFALAGGERVSISGYSPAEILTTVIPLGVKILQAGTHTFRAEKLLNLGADAAVLLEDRLNGSRHDLRADPSYSFTPSGSDHNRFFLHFSAATVTGVGQLGKEAALQVYPNPVTTGLLHVSLTGVKARKIEITLSDALGRKALTSSMDAKLGTAEGLVDTSKLPAGVYLLRVTDGDASTVRKIVVR